MAASYTSPQYRNDTLWRGMKPLLPESVTPTINTDNIGFGPRVGNVGTGYPVIPDYSYNSTIADYTRPIAPSVGPATDEKINFWQNFKTADGRLDFDSIGSAMKGIASLGSVISAFQQNKLSRDSLNFSKEQWQTNLANQLSSYNMSVEDRAYSRAAQNNSAAGTAEEYYNRHKLS